MRKNWRHLNSFNSIIRSKTIKMEFFTADNIDEIISFNKDMKKELRNFLEKTESKKDDFIYIPLYAPKCP